LGLAVESLRVRLHEAPGKASAQGTERQNVEETTADDDDDETIEVDDDVAR
jgi:hypothetical protein